ncbi:alpha-catulin isoform X2 [Dermacentor andersoni]|uniref:alpha-catulin isoform X2 n=1 Tax=Dermacentor andersoni TaxID=34620 RepID=UPI0024179533|nr:alpha-catulin-like isoform X2 [Dermacentor andersoni]
MAAACCGSDSWNLDIKIKSIEKTIAPLVQQISTLVSAKDRALRSEQAVRARVGQAVNLAVERFVSVGEALADDNVEIKLDMYDACRSARAAGASIEQLCDVRMDEATEDRGALARAARALLASVTRVLLLADTVVVKQLLSAKDRVSISLNRLENVANFTEFVKAFSQFGTEMVELAHLTGDRQNDMKDDKRRAQMASARMILERSTMLLLTASKACLRHPECETARENRDTVFLQMRRAMDLVHFVVKDGVIPELACAASSSSEYRRKGARRGSWRLDEFDRCATVHNAVKMFEDLVETMRMTLVGPSCRERLSSALDAVVERTQDFTDSAYTSHEHREKILLLCDRAKLELNQLLRIGVSLDQAGCTSPNEDLENAIEQTLRATADLKQQLRDTALDHADELFKTMDEGELLNRLKNASLAGDHARLEEYADKFAEHAEHVQEVCRLLYHVASTEALQVTAKNTDACIKVYGSQVVSACQTLSTHPVSKIAKENVEVFMEVWQSLVNDVASISREASQQCRPPVQGPDSARSVYMSLPRPGRHGTTSKPLKPMKLDTEEQAKIAKLGLEMKLLTSEMDAETEKWPAAENDIVGRARAMSQMAFSMYQFTRGEGDLKTTQDLFTQAEFFAEEANKLYKVVRQFSYQVPTGQHKKELLEFLDKVPTFVQQLQFTVKNPTVGKAATFTKVDNVIQETKNLMNVISKVVTTCLVCATKYNLDFRGSESGRAHSQCGYQDEEYSYSDGGGSTGFGSKGGPGTVSSSDPGI